MACEARGSRYSAPLQQSGPQRPKLALVGTKTPSRALIVAPAPGKAPAPSALLGRWPAAAAGQRERETSGLLYGAAGALADCAGVTGSTQDCHGDLFAHRLDVDDARDAPRAVVGAIGAHTTGPGT